MSTQRKDRSAILNKLGISSLNKMQEEAFEAISNQPEVVLLSPTGTGKTLAFTLPIIDQLDSQSEQVQALVLAPSRELAQQIEQVVRGMGSGHKVNAVYGGRSGSKDRNELQRLPAILIGTPGRVADHLRRGTFSADTIETLVLDEFDKSLETGFEAEMREIVEALPSLKKKVLTSATQRVDVPDFVGLESPTELNYLYEGESLLNVRVINSPTPDKFETLVNILGHVGQGNGIVFCNLKETLHAVSSHLNEKNVGHACFHGGLEQTDRDRGLIKFRNGTHRILLATDLAARGIDVPEMDYIIHFELPSKKFEYTHRNGRTARMSSGGTSFVIKWKHQTLPDFIDDSNIEEFEDQKSPVSSDWDTLYITGGRRDKISKGDIAGLMFKQGQLDKGELGLIELKHESAYVSVPKAKADQLVQLLNNSRLKKKKVRISILR